MFLVNVRMIYEMNVPIGSSGMYKTPNQAPQRPDTLNSNLGGPVLREQINQQETDLDQEVAEVRIIHFSFPFLKTNDSCRVLTLDSLPLAIVIVPNFLCMYAKCHL